LGGRAAPYVQPRFLVHGARVEFGYEQRALVVRNSFDVIAGVIVGTGVNDNELLALFGIEFDIPNSSKENPR